MSRTPNLEELIKFREQFIEQFQRSTPPEELLLFRPVNMHTLALLNNSQLWFSHPHDFNDPFDCTKATHIYLGDIDYTQILQEIRIRSFSVFSNISNMLLWAHYADGHRGVAITIKPNYQNLKEKHIAISPIFYHLQPLPSPYHGGIEVTNDTFLKKDPIWEYEHEYRLITLSTYLQRGHILQSEPSAPYFSIQNITFGFRCPLEYQTLIQKIIKVPFSRMIKTLDDNRNPTITPQKLPV